MKIITLFVIFIIKNVFATNCNVSMEGSIWEYNEKTDIIMQVQPTKHKEEGDIGLFITLVHKVL